MSPLSLNVLFAHAEGPFGWEMISAKSGGFSRLELKADAQPNIRLTRLIGRVGYILQGFGGGAAYLVLFIVDGPPEGG